VAKRLDKKKKQGGGDEKWGKKRREEKNQVKTVTRARKKGVWEKIGGVGSSVRGTRSGCPKRKDKKRSLGRDVTTPRHAGQSGSGGFKKGWGTTLWCWKKLCRGGELSNKGAGKAMGTLPCKT